MTTSDKFSQHEAMHMASVLTEMVDAYLAEHPFIQEHIDLLEDANRAARLLAGIYQKIGAMD